MRIFHTARIGLVFALAAILLLSGCGAVVLAADLAPVSGGEENTVEQIEVRSVDELIAAIGSDRVLRLAAGEYDLTEAKSYGGDTENEHVSWVDCYDGWELRVNEVENLTIAGESAGACSIVTAPRYANVLGFEWCTGLKLASLTLGHSDAPGYCSGGVVFLLDCEAAELSGCDLYGCGTVGVSSYNSRFVSVYDTVIRECSYGALEAYNSYDVRFVGGTVRDCGKKAEFTAFDLFTVQGSTGFAVLNSEICGNESETLLKSINAGEVLLRGCSIHDNTLGKMDVFSGSPSYSGAVFHIVGSSPVVADCSFADNGYTGAGMYFSYDGELGGVAVDLEGEPLTLRELDRMVCKPFEGYDGPQAAASAPQGEVNEEGVTVFHVDNVDDFLAALGSNTTVYVEAELLDISEAANYGGYASGAYYWDDCYDGPGLVVSGVENLRIVGLGRDKTTLQAVPRYADVLRFENCTGVSVEDLTAGHLREAPGSCSGDVLGFSGCDEVLVRGCGLFGCGVNGIEATGCTGVAVEETELYDCSEAAAQLYDCDGVSFLGCRIYDCGYDGVYVGSCRGVTWEGKKLLGGWTKLA